ncbi:hypothetical protein [Martelella radicis]|uniref:Uncharacterized protein n=1 Tax=Martelella radicis TaxID=1397476 RepID=A0A7W6KGP3_9HYPH|nr:hypothetical protein [Martelella radicis]MBB4120763.1 hypothetical protein [Martelella radicis]
MKLLTICMTVTNDPCDRRWLIDKSSSSNINLPRPLNAEVKSLQAAGQRTASWLGFVVGLCCGMSITAVLAISILGN